MKLFSKMKNQLDERQENDLLHIEKTGFWLAYFGLVIAIFIKLFLNFELKQIATEYILLTCLSIYMLFSCIRKGIWDRHFKPNLTTNLLLSPIAGFGVGVFAFFHSHRYYHLSIAGDFVNFGVYFVLTTLLTFGLLQLLSVVCKKNKVKLENTAFDDLDS